jgi:hypothetical protein
MFQIGTKNMQKMYDLKKKEIYSPPHIKKNVRLETDKR